MALRLTKTNKIVFAVSIILLSSVLGFLVWRVNQQDQLSPEEGEAGQVGSCCCVAGPGGCGGVCDANCPTGTECKTSSTCTNGCDGVCQNIGQGCYFGSQIGMPPYDSEQNKNKCYCTSQGSWVERDTCWCAGNCEGETPRSCTTSLFCEYPLNAYIGPNDKNCRCVNWNEQKSLSNSLPGTYCTKSPPTCNISKTCSSLNMDDCGITGDGKSKSGCTKMTNAYCKSYCEGCHNMSVFYLYCKPKAVATNTCTGGSWATRPTGNIEYGKNIPFKVKNTDSDGVGTRTAKLCTGTVTKCTTGTNVTTSLSGNDISGTLSNLEPDTYTLTVEWKDGKGVAGTACVKTTTFTILEVPTNPDWTVTKSVVGECIDEETENPSAKLRYTIKVKNVGDGSGSVTSIQDAMLYEGSAFPSGLQPSSINPSGTYSGSKITWSGSSFTPSQEKTYTYEIDLSKEYFGSYSNTVTVIVDGDDPQASASIEIDCESEIPQETIPQTGIFDSTLGRVGVGITLLVVGAFVYTLPNKVFFFKGKPISYKYRDRFEKKVAKK